MQMSERTRFTTGTNEQGLLTTKARAAPADGGPVSVAGQTAVPSPVIAQQSYFCFKTDSSPTRAERLSRIMMRCTLVEEHAAAVRSKKQ
jgi:hypothetical protein